MLVQRKENKVFADPREPKLMWKKFLPQENLPTADSLKLVKLSLASPRWLILHKNCNQMHGAVVTTDSTSTSKEFERPSQPDS